MISPHTPPGTRVICINEGRNGRQESGLPITYPRLGNVYTVAEIYPCRSDCGFAAYIPDLTKDHGYCLTLFRYLDLPKCLTDLLHTTPVDNGVVAPSLSPAASLPLRADHPPDLLRLAPVDCSRLRVLSAGAPS